MNRRELLKLLSATGVLATQPSLLSRAFAADSNRLWVTIFATGGWDPTSLCDPKGNIDSTGKGPVNHYSTGDIQTAGNINYGPYVLGELPNSATINFDDFFNRYYNELLVINGLEMGTNNHAKAQQLAISGDGRINQPNIGALLASAFNNGEAMPFVANGGYMNTGGLTTMTRINSTSTFYELGAPNRRAPTSSSNFGTYLPQALFDRVRLAKQHRLGDLLSASTLPQHRNEMHKLQQQRSLDSGLQQLTDYLPNTLDNNSQRRHVQTMCAAMASGLTRSGQISLSGFDSHDEHDRRQYTALANFLSLVDFTLQEAERQGIRDRMNVIIASDFGRRPWYNDGDGKDHWTTSSMMFLGPDFRGNRVIGATTPDFKPRTINPNTLALDDSDNGITLTIEDIHASLRQLAGVRGTAVDNAFPIDGTPLNLFA